jgi:hypothetical protein
MKAIVSKINNYNDYCGMQIDGVDSKSFEGTIIKEYRDSKRCSSHQLWFQTDNVNGGSICASSNEILIDFRKYLGSFSNYELIDE